jgi:hypothetical protein
VRNRRRHLGDPAYCHFPPPVAAIVGYIDVNNKALPIPLFLSEGDGVV